MVRNLLVEVLNDEFKLQLLKELGTCGFVSHTALADKFGRELLDNMTTKKLIVRTFIKRGVIINSFCSLTSSGREILDTVVILQGKKDGSELDGERIVAEESAHEPERESDGEGD